MSAFFVKLIKRPKQACIFAFVVSAFIFGFIALQLGDMEKEEEKNTAIALAQSHASLLESVLNKSFSANYAMAAMLSQSRGNPESFVLFAASLKASYPSVATFSLAPKGSIQFVYPLKGNETALQKSQFTSQREREAYIRGEAQQSIQLHGPLTLYSGYRGFVGRLPVYLDDDLGKPFFWGFTNTVIKLSELIAPLNLDDFLTRQLSYQLTKVDAQRDNEEQIIISSNNSKGSFPKDSIHVDIPLQGTTWRLYLAPQNDWVPTWKIFTGVLATLLCSLLIGYFVYLAIRIRANQLDLENLVAQRTSDLSESNQRMKAMFNAMPDSLYEINLDGVIVAYSSRRLDKDYPFLGSPINKKYSEFFLSNAVKAYDDAFVVAKAQGVTKGHEYYLDDDHGRRWYDLSATYSPTDKDSKGFFVFVSREITHRKAIESELRIAATTFQTQDGILITDTQNRIIRVNSAFETITGYNQAEVIGHTPAIISSGRHSKTFFREMYDHIAKFESWEGEIWNRRKDGEIFPEWLSISVVKDDNNAVTHYVATFKDISETKDNERRINQLNYYDTLTRLANRRLITKDLDHLLSNGNLALRRSAILFIDLDHFKDVNDLRGHLVGDMLLQQVASRLMDATRSGDVVSRFSGDEFLILLEEVDGSISPDRIAYRAKHVAEKIMSAFSAPFDLDGSPYLLTASIGISLVGTQVQSSAEVIKYAELAMYEAKGRGRNQTCFYAPQMHEKVLERVTLDSDFRFALEHEQFILHYQPQWNANKEMVGVEALVRWQHPEKGMISPVSFIPFAEESKLILPLGKWVLNRALQQLADWQTVPSLKHLIMSVNVSALQFSQEGFVDEVKEVIKSTGVPPAHLQIELTESMLVHDQFDIIQKMQSLKQLGVLISLDDFGTGYSSLSYLQQLPIDQLKIDQSFIRAIQESDKQASLAASIIGLGHNLHMEVIAEGVETQAQFDWLKAHRCDLYQGFLLGRPAPSDTFRY